MTQVLLIAYQYCCKGGDEEETKNCRNSSFSYILCHWLSEKPEKLQVWYLTVSCFESFWRYAITHYGKSPKKQLKYLGKWSKIFIYQNFFRKKQIMSFRKKIPLHVSLYMRFLHQENKLSNFVIRGRYPETKNCPNSSFVNNFCHWSPNNKKIFIFCFST